MKSWRSLLACVGVLLVPFCAAKEKAKDPPPQVLAWPASGTPVFRFSFIKFHEINVLGNQHNYVIDTTVENLCGKFIKSAVFNLYTYDKDKARIGDGWISLNDVAPGETVKFQTTLHASGVPVVLELRPNRLPAGLGPAAPPKTVTMTVNSIPQGAGLKLDGADVGKTPKVVEVGVGKHMLEFSKESYNTGQFPLEISPNDASGGSVSYELGASARDTIELRDGSVLSGDLESVSATDVVVKIGGKLQTLSRNQVKRISIVPREAPSQ